MKFIFEKWKSTGAFVVVFICVGALLIAPSFVSAQVFEIPCLGPTLGVGRVVDDCDFNDLMNLVKNILDFLIILSIPMATVAFAYAGYLMLTSVGNSGKISQAKGIFWKVLLGFVFVLSAWLIVRFITSALLNENYEDLLNFTNDSAVALELGSDGSDVVFTDQDTV